MTVTWRETGRKDLAQAGGGGKEEYVHWDPSAGGDAAGAAPGPPSHRSHQWGGGRGANPAQHPT